MRTGRHASIRLIVVASLFTSAAAGGSAFARERSDDGDRPYWRTNLFKRVATDQKFFLTRWWPQEIKDPAFATTLAAGIALAVQSGSGEGGGRDLQWGSAISSASTPAIRTASSRFTRLGNGTTIAAILGITYLSSRRAHNDRLAEATSLASESLLNAGLWVTVLKAATARIRPSNQPEAGGFFEYGAPHNGSFPSGHAMGAFSVAAVFAETYRNKKWVPWVSYGLATLVGASRLALGRHFPGDVIVGAVLGTSIGRGVVARSGEETPSHKGEWGPVVGPGGRGVGVGWSYRWK